MTGPHPAVAETRLAVRVALAAADVDIDDHADDDLRATTEAPLALVACSGGADSLALAAATAFVAPRNGWRAGAVVVDHGLADTSASTAERALQQCRDLGLDPVRLVRVDVAPGGLEGQARRARHAAFDDVVAATGASALLLAHTQDDQAETVLLRLARGSGARSLAGIAPVRGRVHRPLLSVRRAVLREACRAQGLDWHEDPGNAVDGPQTTRSGAPLPRSAVRHRVLPALAAALGSDPVPALARTAEQLRLDADLLDELAAAALASASTGGGLDAVRLAAVPPALLPRVLRTWLVAAGAPAGDLGATHLGAVAALVTSWRGQVGVDVPGGLRVTRADGELVVGDGP